MNRSLLIVICDFLILSMLSMVSFENTNQSKMNKEETIAESVQQSYVDSQLVDLLKMSLDKEREQRSQLSSQVQQYSKKAEQVKAQSERQKNILAQREKELKALSKSKKELEDEMGSIVAKSKELELKVKTGEEKNLSLQGEILSTMQKLNKTSQDRKNLESQLSQLHQSDSTLKARLEVVQQELDSNKMHLEKLKGESDRLKSENKAMELEKQTLATQLQVASVKTQIYEENLKKTEALVEIEKSEKQKIQEHADKLAEGVGELAVSSEKISKEVRDLRPLTASEIFEDAKANCVNIEISYARTGLFGKNKYADIHKSVIINANNTYWLLMSVADTVFDAASRNFIAPETLSITAWARDFKFKPASVFYLKENNRILALAVPKAFVEKTKIKVYQRALEPFRFSEAIIIQPDKFYYGQIPYKADVKLPSLAVAETSLFSAIFGDFSPSYGDMVFARTGEFIGLMVNSSDIGLVRSFNLSGELLLNERYDRQKAAAFQKNVSGKK